jgi:hypothetical protein
MGILIRCFGGLRAYSVGMCDFPKNWQHSQLLLFLAPGLNAARVLLLCALRARISGKP